MSPARRPWSRKETERYIADNFANRISWVAARLILDNLTHDEGYPELSLGTRQRIERFLASHPAPALLPKEEADVERNL